MGRRSTRPAWRGNTRKPGSCRLRDWAHSIAQRPEPRRAKVALARKLAATLHAMWFSVFQDTVTAEFGIPKQWREPEYLRLADRQRSNLMRPAGTRGGGKIAPFAAAMTGYSTSILPPLNANMRCPRDDYGGSPRARQAHTGARIKDQGSSRQRRGCELWPFMRNCCAAIPTCSLVSAARWSVVFEPGAPSMAPSEMLFSGRFTNRDDWGFRTLPIWTGLV